MHRHPVPIHPSKSSPTNQKQEPNDSIVVRNLRHEIEQGFLALESKLDAIQQIIAKHRKEHLLVSEVAELTGRSSYTIRRWIKERKLHAIRLKDGGPRGKLLVPRAELERLIGAGRGREIPSRMPD